MSKMWKAHVLWCASCRRFVWTVGMLVMRCLYSYLPKHPAGGEAMSVGPPLQDRLFSKFEPVTESGCWLWTACLNGDGYGQIWHNGRMRGAHRAIYEVLVGPIPDGLTIDHLCRVRCCVNPHHMEVVSKLENTLRGVGQSAINARKTHCKNGHLFDSGNTIIESSGKRKCKTCHKVNVENFWKRRKLANQQEQTA